MYNERTNTHTPYPLMSPYSVPSQPNLHATNRAQLEPQTSNARQKSYLIQKVQALLPYLAEILKQNDDRTLGIVGKLSGLRDNLDGIFEDLEKELIVSGEENE
jgi:hypothetical protein